MPSLCLKEGFLGSVLSFILEGEERLLELGGVFEKFLQHFGDYFFSNIK